MTTALLRLFGGIFVHPPVKLLTYSCQTLHMGKYPHPESIRRTRAKLQKDNPELRGKLYAKRKGQAEAEMREEMGKDLDNHDDHHEDRLPPTSLRTTNNPKTQP